MTSIEDAQAMLLATFPFSHVLLALFEQVHAQTVGQVLLVSAEITVSIMEGVNTISLTLCLLVLTNIIGPVCALLHPNTVANTISPCAFIEISVVVTAHTIPTPVPGRVFTCNQNCFRISADDVEGGSGRTCQASTITARICVGSCST